MLKGAFEFALLAKERFENGDLEDKKVIFKAIGLNLRMACQNNLISTFLRKVV